MQAWKLSRLALAVAIIGTLAGLYTTARALMRGMRHEHELRRRLVPDRLPEMLRVADGLRRD